MKITIDYVSSWRNKLAEDTGEKGRKPLKNELATQEVPITINTTLGILSRLIGDIRPLKEAMKDDRPFYFRDIVDQIHFEDRPNVVNNEVVFLKKITKNIDDPQTTSGVAKSNLPIFYQEWSSNVWGILELSQRELYNHVINGQEVLSTTIVDTIGLTHACNTLGHYNDNEEKLSKDELSTLKDNLSNAIMSSKYIKVPEKIDFDKGKLLNKLYCLSMYVALEKLHMNGVDISALVIWKSDGRFNFKGFASGGSITTKEFCAYDDMKKGLNTGTPLEFSKREKYIIATKDGLKESYYVKTYGLTKKSGQLDIYIDVDKEREDEIRHHIDCAGVGAIKVGKKGLAYVSYIS